MGKQSERICLTQTGLRLATTIHINSRTSQTDRSFDNWSLFEEFSFSDKSVFQLVPLETSAIRRPFAEICSRIQAKLPKQPKNEAHKCFPASGGDDQSVQLCADSESGSEAKFRR